MNLRDYQRASIDALNAYWAKGGGNALIVIPTGAGKSFVIAELMRELIAEFPRLRIAAVTHVRELIAQNFQELIRAWPSAPAGVYSAGLGRRDARAQILFCGVQSVWNKIGELGPIDLLLVDEAHLIPRNAETRYRRMIDSMRAIVPDMRIVGLTATPFRLDSGRLDLGDERIFDDIVYEAKVGDLIRDGYLSPLLSKATATKLDVSGVAKRGGDYVPSALERAIDIPQVTQEAVAEMVALGTERRAWLAFCTGVNHTMHVRDAVRSHGITCEVVTGETPSGERDRIIAAFRAGRIRCLSSVAVLFTGFNVPHVDLVALLRPTCSAGIYMQSVGRAFRIAPGKTDALILDYAGLVKKFGPIDTIEVAHGYIKGDPDEEKRVLAKECPNCQALVAVSFRHCPHCDYEFPRIAEEPKHDATADGERPILSAAPPAWVSVSNMRLYRHEKPGRTPTLRVEYSCGLSVHREWVCIEHTGFAGDKASRWWQNLGGRFPAPRTIEHALNRKTELNTPAEILVRPSGKYFEIVGIRMRRAA